MGAITYEQLRDGIPVRVISIDFAGQTYRFSTKISEATDADGVTFPLRGGLKEAEFLDELNLFATEPELRQVSAEVFFPVDIALQVQQGHDLASATGEYALWVEGTAWEDRRILLRGQLTQPVYGSADEPVAFSLEEFPWQDSTSTHAASQVVDEDTWSDSASANRGDVYPIVFGTPGQYTDNTGAVARTSGTWASIVDNSSGQADTLLIAAHPVVASTVSIYSDGSESWETGLSVTQDTDRLSQVVSTVDVTGVATANWRDGDNFWVAWESGGSLRDPLRTSAIEGAGSLLYYLLERTSLRVDFGRLAAVVPALNTYKVSGYIDEPTTIWDWLASTLLPLLPVAIYSGADGLYPVLWNYDATALDAVAHIQLEPGVERVGRVTYETKPEDIVNRFTLRYAYRTRKDAAQRRAVLQADIEANASTQTYASSHYVKVSALRYGEQAQEDESAILYDQSTAHRINEWRARAYGFPQRVVTYDVGYRFASLEPGDVVTLTDSELYFTDQVALVRSITWGDATLLLTLLILEDPIRDTRQTG